MSSIIRARNGDMVVSFRWWSAEQSPARRHQQNTPIRHHPDFTTPALGDSRSVQPLIWATDSTRVPRDREPRTERPHPAVAAVSGDNPAEGLPRQELHQLGEERFAGVHRRLQGPPRKLAPTSNRGHRFLLGNPQNSWRSEPVAVS